MGKRPKAGTVRSSANGSSPDRGRDGAGEAPVRSPLLPGDSPDVLRDVRDVIGEGYERWLDTPHWWLGARTPRSVIGTELEGELRNLLWHIRAGIPT